MKSKVEKGWLLATVQKNADEHQDIFLEAVEGYRNEAVKQLEAHIERIKGGKLERVYVSLPQPENHIRDYKRVLDMISRNVDTVIELSEQDYASYVLDDWQWKRQFLASNSAYSVTSAKLLEELDDE